MRKIEHSRNMFINKCEQNDFELVNQDFYHVRQAKNTESPEKPIFLLETPI